ncbi:MAG: SufE family protein [Pseudomonadota bacterium]
MEESFDELVDTFSFLEDWEERYRHVIELGKAMPPLPDGLKGPETKVDGCASQVWLVPEVSGAGGTAKIDFQGDSDAIIVRGLIAVLKLMFADKTADEIVELDASSALNQLGLDQHLSAQRSNGLKAMIARIKAVASAAKAAV